MEGEREQTGRYFREKPEERQLTMRFDIGAGQPDSLGDSLADFVEQCGERYGLGWVSLVPTKEVEGSFELSVTVNALESDLHELAGALAYIIEEEDMIVPNGPVAYRVSLPESIRAKIEANHENFHRI